MNKNFRLDKIFLIFKELLKLVGGIPIVCAGSVFKSWTLIKAGFVKCLENPKYKRLRLKELKLVTIKEDSTIGAALLASRVFDSNSELDKNVMTSSLINILDHIVISNRSVCYDKIHNTEAIICTEDAIVKEA